MASRSQNLGSHIVGISTHSNMGTMNYTANRAFTDLRMLNLRYHLEIYEKSKGQESAMKDIIRVMWVLQRRCSAVVKPVGCIGLRMNLEPRTSAETSHLNTTVRVQVTGRQRP